jgi:hypothetical protein
MLTYDVWLALWWTNPATGAKELGLGLGTLLMALNVVLIASYTFSCHSLRHLVGGRKDCLSASPGCQLAWKCTSALNKRHGLYAWMSLFSVGFTDVYIRLCSMGTWTDWRIF